MFEGFQLEVSCLSTQCWRCLVQYGTAQGSASRRISTKILFSGICNCRNIHCNGCCVFEHPPWVACGRHRFRNDLAELESNYVRIRIPPWSNDSERSHQGVCVRFHTLTFDFYHQILYCRFHLKIWLFAICRWEQIETLSLECLLVMKAVSKLIGFIPLRGCFRDWGNLWEFSDVWAVLSRLVSANIQVTSRCEPLMQTLIVV